MYGLVFGGDEELVRSTLLELLSELLLLKKSEEGERNRNLIRLVSCEGE